MNLKNWFAVLAAILVAILITGTAAPRGVLAFDPGGPPPAGGVPTVVTGNWEWINYQPTGGSYSPQQQINADNVELLELKWIFPYTTLADDEHLFNAGVQLGAQAPPLVIDGIVYVAKNDGRIHAVDALDGTEIWESEGISQVDWQALVDEFP